MIIFVVKNGLNDLDHQLMITKIRQIVNEEKSINIDLQILSAKTTNTTRDPVDQKNEMINLGTKERNPLVENIANNSCLFIISLPRVMLFFDGHF